MVFSVFLILTIDRLSGLDNLEEFVAGAYLFRDLDRDTGALLGRRDA